MAAGGGGGLGWDCFWTLSGGCGGVEETRSITSGISIRGFELPSKPTLYRDQVDVNADRTRSSAEPRLGVANSRDLYFTIKEIEQEIDKTTARKPRNKIIRYHTQCYARSTRK